ncbi:uncharacterized protein LOC62_03G004540 [Vanrija pseudolonga]|uniref:R3H-associated N-terminal domain-containing protein n=1 Tax=Vanrija pseudolonga TaxID=143232 RepID=A0AAF1BI06_9TREE|nr:hypothetical protein LOC62_03G004540 [Vanrija pseudolonga]
MAAPDAAPVPLRLPAILQNSRDRSLRQVEAYNAQQREKAAARREQRKDEVVAGPSKRGKRFTQRLNNSQFIDNPHISAPRRSDFAPSVPLHQRPLRPAFPSDAIERSAPIAPSAANRRDPLSRSSQAGAFSTSLKGTRALLRRGGRRAEVIVPALEGVVRAWLGGEFGVADGVLHWRVLESTPVEVSKGARTSGTNGHRVPPQHRVEAPLPPLPVQDGHVPALLELSRSAAHLSLAVPDSFDRLVVHLVARYYDLVSWSENEATVNGEVVRLTHLIRPVVARAKAPPASHALVTPETSDVSGHSASEASEATERESDGSVTEHEDAASEPDTSFQSISERFGLVGDGDDDDEDWDNVEEHVTARFGGLGLHRTTSHGSSAYAGSEGGLSESEALAESVLHADDERSSLGGGDHSPLASTVASPVSSVHPLPPVRRGPPQRLGGNGDWEDKPTFFDHLFGE